MKEFDNQFDLAFKIVLEINIENGKTKKKIQAENGIL